MSPFTKLLFHHQTRLRTQSIFCKRNQLDACRAEKSDKQINKRCFNLSKNSSFCRVKNISQIILIIAILLVECHHHSASTPVGFLLVESPLDGRDAETEGAVVSRTQGRQRENIASGRMRSAVSCRWLVCAQLLLLLTAACYLM